jgi:hypothetical protein
MWFYIPAVILVALLAWWLSRSNLYRHFRSGRDPGQPGSGHSGGHYEGPAGNPGQSSTGGGGPSG